MSKQSFLDCKKPLLTAMIQKPDPDSCISAIRNAVYDGAEAFGFQICELKREYRDEETFRHIFSYCGSHPIYITNYRQRYSDKVSDEDRTEEMLTAMRAGAVLMDVMGDLYCPDPSQLTYDAEAVKKQKELIHEIHDMGGEVLMSAHIWEFVPEQYGRTAEQYRHTLCTQTKAQHSVCISGQWGLLQVSEDHRTDAGLLAGNVCVAL